MNHASFVVGCTSFQISTVRLCGKPYIHAGVDLCHRLIIGGKLVDLHTVANQLACDFYFELGQFTLGDGIWLGDDGDNINLGGGKKKKVSLGKMQLRL